MNTNIFESSALPFEKDLSRELSKVWDYVEDNTNTYWTFAINKILGKTVREFRKNFKVAACKLDTADCKEWMYDFVCYENNILGMNDPAAELRGI